MGLECHDDIGLLREGLVEIPLSAYKNNIIIKEIEWSPSPATYTGTAGYAIRIINRRFAKLSSSL
jgi:hypothetical protein